MSKFDLTVIYDGGCPLCSREILHYQKFKSLKTIQWLDLTKEAEKLEREFGIQPLDALAQFHVMDGNRQWHKGADGFVLLWQALPYYRWLARFCIATHLLPLLRWGYAHFAAGHFKRRCAQGVCR